MDVTPHLRMGLAVLMLVGASVSDLRTRRVRNHYWFPFLVFAAAFLLHDVAGGGGGGGPQRAQWRFYYGLAAGLTALWYLVWRVHGFGGADAKGLMVLCWLTPWPLDPSLPIPPALDAVANATVMVLVLPLVFLVRNAAAGRFRLPAALLGVPMDLDAAQARQVWPMQRAGPDGLRWKYWQRIGGDLDDVYRDLRAAGVTRVWTTPKIPFMVPIGLGLVVAWVYGNLWLRLMSAWVGP